MRLRTSVGGDDRVAHLHRWCIGRKHGVSAAVQACGGIVGSAVGVCRDRVIVLRHLCYQESHVFGSTDLALNPRSSLTVIPHMDGNPALQIRQSEGADAVSAISRA